MSILNYKKIFKYSIKLDIQNMRLFIENRHGTLWFCLNVIRWVGFLVPDELSGIKKKIYPFYAFFCFMFIVEFTLSSVGIYVITQTGYLIQVWGNLCEMTNASFLLFTNLAFTIKIFNVMLRKHAIQAIIDEGDQELKNEVREEGKKIVESSNMDNRKLIYLYAFVTVVTVSGWAIGAEKNQLPLRAWYPYDTSKSPAYEITYIHQSIAVVFLAIVNASLDQVVTSLVSICRARLKLVNLSLRTLGRDFAASNQVLTRQQEQIFAERLHQCVLQHQVALGSATQIQNCFSEPILAQFTVSMVIICATAFQLAVEVNNSVLRIVAMTTYLMCMVIQVFIYCYQGNHLTEECFDVAEAAYECPWYLCSVPLRRTLLIMMIRSKRVVTLTAGGFTTLSLDSFMSIIKTSYSFFTVLQQMEA